VGDKERKKENAQISIMISLLLLQEKIMPYLKKKKPIHILETELSIGQFKSACSNLCQDRC